ncbi:hypothetical protein FACS1894217_14250 [Clostridia bacterium]|nr:hypothetical protein FACS1894217_14250 [Clostridia bacterium]
MAKLLYQGHGSYRITAANGKVIYVDPYAGKGYDKPADLILVTHQHRDHNQIQLVSQNQLCRVISTVEALANGEHQIFTVDGVEIEAVTAKNFMHSPKKCVGYILTVDGVTVYAAGDTSKTAEMETFKARALDYALFPCDGMPNMGLKTAAKCAEIVGAKHNIPVHMKPGALFDPVRAHNWNAPNKLVIEPGEEIEL